MFDLNLNQNFFFNIFIFFKVTIASYKISSREVKLTQTTICSGLDIPCETNSKLDYGNGKMLFKFNLFKKK